MSDHKREIQVYDFLHKIDAHGNYQLNQQLNHNDKTKNLASFIHNNYNKMHAEELKSIVTKLMTPNEMKSKLLKFELEHYEEIPKSLTLLQFTKEARTILSRYQHKAGGFILEDDQWTVYTSNSDGHSVLQNEVLFENSLSKYDLLDTVSGETHSYLDLIMKRLNSLSSDIKITKDIRLEEEYGVAWILIKCTHTGMEMATPEITL